MDKEQSAVTKSSSAVEQKRGEGRRRAGPEVVSSLCCRIAALQLEAAAP